MRNEEITAFLTIVNTGSLSAAADKLFLSQSALSHRMSSLESEVGKQLIVRNKGHRNISLTEAGKAFIPIAERWESLFIGNSRLRFLRVSSDNPDLFA